MPNILCTYVIDVDETICTVPSIPGEYMTCDPDMEMIAKINKLYHQGHTIILFTARGMRSCDGDLEAIEAIVRPVLVDWLDKYGVEYTRLIMGKPWGPNVRYVDDRNMSIEEFLNESEE